MKVDVPLFTLLLTASAAASPFSYTNGTSNSTSWSDTTKQISELEKEIASLKSQLEDASQASCTTAGGSGSGPYASSSSSAAGAGYTSMSNAASSSSMNGGSSSAGSGHSASTEYQTIVETITRTDTTIVSTIVLTKTVMPMASTSSAVSASWSSAASSCPPGDYYAPLAPSSDSTHVPTYTVIVTPGQSPTANPGNGTGHTCTETYVGTGSIPSPSASATTSYVSSTITLPITVSKSTASAPYGYHNGTAASSYGTASAPSGHVPSGMNTRPASSYPASPVMSGTAPVQSANSTMSPTATSGSLSTAVANSTSAMPNCASFCDEMTSFNDWDVTPLTCTQRSAGTLVNTPSGQSSVGCATSFTPAVDLCQITLEVHTSGTGRTYMEVWLPNGNSSSWNGRSMSTDNGGLNGCVHYVDMQYVSGMGFASIGDNAGHNGSSFDGTWTMNNNEAVVDWAYRARHASIDVGKQVIKQYYEKKADYSYYIGCSAGGAQGLQSAQKYPNDFDGIIAGASASDFNHLQDWSAHFRQITGAAGNDSFLTLADWTTVQSYIFAVCDKALDGVDDGIIEDPTICKFDADTIPVCNTTVTSSCLNATQIETVKDVFKPLYNDANELIYPSLLYGAQVDAFKLGLLSGSIQGIAQDFYRGAVYNDSSFDILTLSKADYDRADALDDLHGNPSAFNGDLSSFAAANKKLIMYHGMADPMTSGYNSQRYYQKVASTMSLDSTAMDEFLRFFRISGMAHCGVGGISGAGAWMFGQSLAADQASNNIVSNLVDWVENGEAPDVMTGTKFWYDTPSLGIEFERSHCRYPYRTTFKGGNATTALTPDGWYCAYIDDWQNCEGVTCDADGTFT